MTSKTKDNISVISSTYKLIILPQNASLGCKQFHGKKRQKSFQTRSNINRPSSKMTTNLLKYVLEHPSPRYDVEVNANVCIVVSNAWNSFVSIFTSKAGMV